MTSNDDLMYFLKDFKIQAETNNEELKMQVKTRIVELAVKVDKAKDEATEKEKNDKINMKKLQYRLDTIEKRLMSNKEECDRKKQQECLARTNKFMGEVGLPEVKDDSNEKERQTWSKHIERSTQAQKEQRKEAKEKQKEKHWHKKVEIKERIEKEKKWKE